MTERDGCRLVFTKVAPERVLPLRQVHLSGPSPCPSRSAATEIAGTPRRHGRKGRCGRSRSPTKSIARPPSLPGADAARELKEGLTLLAIIGLGDSRPRGTSPPPSRPAGPPASKSKSLQATTPAAARAIADQIGLMGKDDRVVKGEEFGAMTDGERLAVLPSLRILSREPGHQGSS